MPAIRGYPPTQKLVMAGLVPAIHVFDSWLENSWMPGTRPGMTIHFGWIKD